MATFTDRLDDDLRAWLGQQPVFFVATAAHGSRINLSPKGMDCLRVVDDTTVAYVDLTGSGNETNAHIAADGRLTLMACSFDRKPRITRLYGTGRVLAVEDAAATLGVDLPTIPGARQVIVCDVDQVQTSCGYAVPVMELVEERQTLRRWAESQGEDGLATYRAERNAVSIDGLPATVPAG